MHFVNQFGDSVLFVIHVVRLLLNGIGCPKKLEKQNGRIHSIYLVDLIQDLKLLIQDKNYNKEVQHEIPLQRS
jgi:hypothetical protein